VIGAAPGLALQTPCAFLYPYLTAHRRHQKRTIFAVKLPRTALCNCCQRLDTAPPGRSCLYQASVGT